ncbi:MAG: hypothetical protein A4S12_07475 [Proteobacteria bacterium SG_bin5]|nr:MAG: hypothetical protein A4S12_07475 [Proteobacteria bacterium SG_bin5]
MMNVTKQYEISALLSRTLVHIRCATRSAVVLGNYMAILTDQSRVIGLADIFHELTAAIGKRTATSRLSPKYFLSLKANGHEYTSVFIVFQ